MVLGGFFVGWFLCGFLFWVFGFGVGFSGFFCLFCFRFSLHFGRKLLHLNLWKFRISCVLNFPEAYLYFAPTMQLWSSAVCYFFDSDVQKNRGGRGMEPQVDGYSLAFTR